jgi:hypothetical protein
MTTYNVTYTAYRPGSSEVISEGTMPLNVDSSYQAEQTVKAMFSNLEVIVRYVENA